MSNITATPIKISLEEAMELARSYFVARIMSRSKPTDAELKYFPYYLYSVRFDLERQRKLLKTRDGLSSTNLDVIVSATGGKVSMSDFAPKMEEIQVVEDDLVDAILSENNALEKAEKETRTVVFRRLKSKINLIDFESKLFYRPYWVVFYGERKKGEKVFYVPVPADGYDVKRTT